MSYSLLAKDTLQKEMNCDKIIDDNVDDEMLEDLESPKPVSVDMVYDNIMDENVNDEMLDDFESPKPVLMDMKEEESFEDFGESLSNSLSLHGNKQDLDPLELVYDKECC